MLQGGQRVLGTCTLLQLHAPYRHGHEPEHRPPKAFFEMVSLIPCLVPAPVVSLPSPGAPAHTALWRHQHCRFCVVLPSRRPQLTEALSAFPGYLHLLQMSFARDVQNFICKASKYQTMTAFNLYTGFWFPKGLLLLPS